MRLGVPCLWLDGRSARLPATANDSDALLARNPSRAWASCRSAAGCANVN
jgi:hypothetical protein